jgi:MFS family permease
LTAAAAPQRGLQAGLIGALWVAEVTGSFETAMILAALKALIADFGDPALVGWLITGYLIVGAGLAAVVGRLGDIFGRRKVLIIVLAVGAAGSLVSALSTSFAMLLAGRVVQGATAVILPLVVGLARENVRIDRVPMAIGLMASGASLGTAAGLVLGGLIVDTWSWHGVFFASAGLCLASILAIMAAVPPSPSNPPKDKVDWFSGVLFAPGVALMLLYTTLGPKRGWGDPLSLALLALGTVLLAEWVRRSLTSPNPLISLRVFRNRAIAVVGLATVLISVGALQITVIFTILLQAPTWTGIGLGLSATAAGLVKLPSNLTSTFAGPFGGWLTGRGGGRPAMIVGGVMTALGWTMVLFDTSSVPIVIAELLVISFGTSMLFSVAPTIVAQASPPDRVSEIAGMIGVIRSLFMAVGAQLVTTLLAVEVVRRGTETYPAPFAYQLTIGAMIGLTLLAIIVSCALPKGIPEQA